FASLRSHYAPIGCTSHRAGSACYSTPSEAEFYSKGESDCWEGRCPSEFLGPIYFWPPSYRSRRYGVGPVHGMVGVTIPGPPTLSARLAQSAARSRSASAKQTRNVAKSNRRWRFNSTGARCSSAAGSRPLGQQGSPPPPF